VGKLKIRNPFYRTKAATTPGGNDLQALGSRSAAWVSWGQDSYYYLAYQNIPQLKAVVNRLSDAYIRGHKEIITQKKDIITSGDVYDVIGKPNPLQSKYEFWETFYRNYTLFDRVHVLKISTNLGLHSMVVLPTMDVKIVPVLDSDIRTELELSDFILRYDLYYNGKIIELDVNDVWTFTSSSLSGRYDGYLYPDRKLSALHKPISNIELNYKSRNELMAGQGAIGMISSEKADADGTLALEPDEIKEFQESMKKYRLASGDYKYLITKAAMKWTPMTVPIKDMMFLESLQSDSDAICDVLNYPAILLASSQRDSKYANLNEVRKLLYADNIIANSEKIDSSFNQNFKQFLKLDKLYTDYYHLEVLQSDKKINAVTNKLNTETIQLLNNQIFAGIIKKDTAVNQLIYQGYTKEVAEGLLTDNLIKAE